MTSNVVFPVPVPVSSRVGDIVGRLQSTLTVHTLINARQFLLSQAGTVEADGYYILFFAHYPLKSFHVAAYRSLRGLKIACCGWFKHRSAAGSKPLWTISCPVETQWLNPWFHDFMNREWTAGANKTEAIC